MSHDTALRMVIEFADGVWNRTVEYATSEGGVVGIHTDITDAVTLERQLRAAKELAEAGDRDIDHAVWVLCAGAAQPSTSSRKAVT